MFCKMLPTFKINIRWINNINHNFTLFRPSTLQSGKSRPLHRRQLDHAFIHAKYLRTRLLFNCQLQIIQQFRAVWSEWSREAWLLIEKVHEEMQLIQFELRQGILWFMFRNWHLWEWRSSKKSLDNYSGEYTILQQFSPRRSQIG